MISKLFGIALERAGFALAGIGAAAAILWRAWSGGAKRERERQEARRAAEMAEAHGNRLDTMKTAQESRDAANNATDDDVAHRLRSWTRD